MTNSLPLPALLASALLLATGCPTTDAIDLDDEAGTTTAPGDSTSATDTTSDTTSDTGDTGDTTTGELEPCTIEWVLRTPIVHGQLDLPFFTPLAIDGDELAVYHHAGQPPDIESRVTRFSTLDAAIGTSLAFDTSAGQDAPESILALPDGDVVIGTSDYQLFSSYVRRLDPDGASEWVHFEQNDVGVTGIELLPQGRLAMLATRFVSASESDLLVTLMDAESGDVLDTWQHDVGTGAWADIGWAITSGSEGSLFVAASETSVDDSTRPVVYGFAPGSITAPAWKTTLFDMPGVDRTPHGMALAPTGPLFVVEQLAAEAAGGVEGPRVHALDPASGEPLWTLELTALDVPELEWALVGALAADADKLVIGGVWQLAGATHAQAFLLELELDGTLICQATFDDFDGGSLRMFDFHDAKIDAEGLVYASGRTTPYLDRTQPVELLLAKIR